MIEFLFWLLALVVVYPFAGYPLTLRLLAMLKPRPYVDTSTQALPTVSLLISAYNEEGVIAGKLENALALDYPPDRREVVVVSDASDDRTDAIVGQFADQGVRLLRQSPRRGKSAALNWALPQCQGEVVVFTDANAFYPPSALKELVKPFADGQIGFVTGWTRYSSTPEDPTAESTGIYSRLEMEVKRLESRIGSCIGADGAIFAIRQNLYSPIREQDINDLVIPLKIIAQGHRGILVKEAFCHERTASGLQGEYYRQRRITARTLHALKQYGPMFHPRRHTLLLFQIIGHKGLKLLLPINLLLLLVLNGLLVPQYMAYLFFMIAQLGFYGLALAGPRHHSSQFLTRMVRLASSFTMVNFAILRGWIDFLTGKSYVTWTKQRN
jgi:cellulose synthase/poly-beta-1,6-N-acetylglucosamine synthase-like glycosyltransferase